MIRVDIYLSEGKIKGFNVSGHAEFEDTGKDIVCAGVSILTYNTIDTFTDILKIKDYIKYSIEENDIELTLDKELDKQKMHDAQLILQKYELGIQSILKEYSDYIELYYTEV
ncbi:MULTISPECIES: ribosomal-processing cysteine protease Prp [Helcococcus]|uniref:Ribosomal processing cysteine protease Prp n=1 Tax=Helcococcus bovis TaxID=3153252 RepID=A0ABW9F6C5_9FIRM